jgi:adenylate cyclase
MPSLFKRLKERMLVQWALAYLCGAWVVVEASSLVVEQFSLPTVVGQVVSILAVAGFFLVLVIAWYHGEKDRQRVSGPELLIIALLLLISGGVLSMLGGGDSLAEGPSAAVPVPEEDHRPSIAVLPFDNYSPNPEDAYFADGMQEQLVSTLTRIEGLSVRGRTSAMAYKDTPKRIPEIAEEIGVTFILEGSARMAGQKVIVTAQLLDARKDEHLWSNEYDREFSVENVVSVQRDIAQHVAEAVGAELTPEEQQGISESPTESAKAYDLFLQGRVRWWTRSESALQEAMELYQAALAEDSTFALAYAAMAETLAILPQYGGPPSSELLPAAREAARKAKSLAPDLPGAYSASGYIKMMFEWDWDGAEREFRKAIELDPDYATAHQWYSELLGIHGRWDEAITEAGIAVDLEPLSPAPTSIMGYLLAFSGELAESVPWFERGYALSPLHAPAINGLALVYVLLGDYSAARPWWDRAALRDGTDPEVGRLFLAALTDPEMIPEAVRGISTLPDPVIRAQNLILLGKDDEAIAALEQGLEEEGPFMPWIASRPVFERVRGDMRVRNLLRTMNLDG